MLQVADEVVLHMQIALVDLCDKRQFVHVFQRGPWSVMDDSARGGPEAEAGDLTERPALRYFLDGEVKLFATDEVHRRRCT